MIVYKALNKGKSPYRHFDWPLPKGKRPGRWIEVAGPPRLCAVGFHGFLRREDAERVGSEVYEMEIAGDTVKDTEKVAGTRARLLRKLWAFGPEGPIERGFRNCLTCHKPHDSYIVQKGLAPQWGDLTDGHSYSPEPWERYVARLGTGKARLDGYRAARSEAVKGHAGPGTYLPVVPAFHAFKPWSSKPGHCGTCGLEESLHEGWEDRDSIAEEFRSLDRWELLLVIQELRAA